MSIEYNNGIEQKPDNKKKIIVIMSAVIAVLLAVITALLIINSSDSEKLKKDSNHTSAEQVKFDLSTETGRIKKDGKIIVGITEYPPMNYKENGEWTGFDTELTQAFAERLGVEVEFVVLADWDAKFTELKSGSIDCIWNGMTITDEAKKNSSVSDSYAQSSQVVVLPADKAAQVKSVEDLKAFTFAVEKGSAGQAVAENNKLNFTEVDVMTKALLEVKSGASDGCIIDLTTANATVGKSDYASLAVSLTLSTEEFGVAFRKDSDLTAEFNAFLQEYRESGELAKLAEKYNVEIK